MLTDTGPRPERTSSPDRAPDGTSATGSPTETVGPAAASAPTPAATGGADRRGDGTTESSPSPATTRPRLSRADVVREAERAGEDVVADLSPDARVADVERRVAEALAFLRRRLTGDYQVDEFGFDAEFTDTVVLTLLRPLYRHWFRVEVRGIENVPDTGAALVVANHSGTIALDALMTQVAVHDEHPRHRHLRMLGADLVFSMPVVGDIARKSGSTLAANPDAERLLAQGHLVGVWPEGFKGIGKPFSERYKLQRFGRGGFVSAALRTRAPIVPCAIVGAEEIYPILGNLSSVARLLGLPYAPVTPTWPLLGPLGLVPLPSKWLIEFGPPIVTDEIEDAQADDPMLVFDLTDQVRETIQQTLYSLLVSRRSVFF
ncbi:lysophospholipid acyltransferase family protein [Thalassiella azotivora]